MSFSIAVFILVPTRPISRAVATVPSNPRANNRVSAVHWLAAGTLVTVGDSIASVITGVHSFRIRFRIFRTSFVQALHVAEGYGHEGVSFQHRFQDHRIPALGPHDMIPRAAPSTCDRTLVRYIKVEYTLATARVDTLISTVMPNGLGMVAAMAELRAAEFVPAYGARHHLQYNTASGVRSRVRW
jgi:hypothetical protein